MNQQVGQEEERTRERDHHPAPEGCQNTRTIHPDRVAVVGEADNDNEPSQRNIWARNMVRLDWCPTVRTGVSHRLIGKMQTLKKALLMYVLATTQERPAWVFVR